MDLKKLKTKRVCTIKKGLYHPWSEDNTSVKEFLTIAPEVDYIVLSNDVKVDDYSNKKIKVKKGDKLECEIYLQEGECAYFLNGKEVDSECLEYDKSSYKKI